VEQDEDFEDMELMKATMHMPTAATFIFSRGALKQDGGSQCSCEEVSTLSFSEIKHEHTDSIDLDTFLVAMTYMKTYGAREKHEHRQQ
jgi:hypothetical protein